MVDITDPRKRARGIPQPRFPMLPVTVTLAALAIVVVIVYLFLRPDPDVEMFLEAAADAFSRPDSELTAAPDIAVRPLTPVLVKVEALRAHLSRRTLLSDLQDRRQPSNFSGAEILGRLIADPDIGTLQLAFMDESRIRSRSASRICIGQDTCYPIGGVRVAQEGSYIRTVANLGDELGSSGVAVLMGNGRSTIGQILVDVDSFRVEQLSRRLFAISSQQQAGQDRFRHDAPTQAPVAAPDLKASVALPRTAPTDTEFNIGLKACPNPSKEYTIEVLVGTTKRAQAEASRIGRDLGEQIQLGLGSFNTSFERSQITGKTAVTVIETSYVEMASIDKDRDELLKPNGALSAFRKTRAETKADVAVLVVHNDSVLDCGRAAGILVRKDMAYAVVNWRCVADNFALAHEIGHLVGAHHDPASLERGEVVTPPYAHGYITTGTPRYGTIMANQDACTPRCGRLMAWANPDKMHKSQVLGTIDRHFDACIWRQRFPEVAGFDGG